MSEIRALARQFIAATVDKLGTDEEVVYEIVSMVHKPELSEQFQQAVKDQLGPEKTQSLLDEQRESSIVRAIFKDEMSGVELAKAEDLYKYGKDRFRAGYTDYYLNGLTSSLDLSTIESKLTLGGGFLFFGVVGCLYPPAGVVLGALAIGGGYAYGIGKTLWNAAEAIGAKTPEQRRENFYNMGAGVSLAGMSLLPLAFSYAGKSISLHLPNGWTRKLFGTTSPKHAAVEPSPKLPAVEIPPPPESPPPVVAEIPSPTPARRSSPTVAQGGRAAPAAAAGDLGYAQTEPPHSPPQRGSTPPVGHLKTIREGVPAVVQRSDAATVKPGTNRGGPYRMPPQGELPRVDAPPTNGRKNIPMPILDFLRIWTDEFIPAYFGKGKLSLEGVIIKLNGIARSLDAEELSFLMESLFRENIGMHRDLLTALFPGREFVPIETGRLPKLSVPPPQSGRHEMPPPLPADDPPARMRPL